MTKKAPDRERLEALYEKYNRRDYVHPDPLEFLYDYPSLDDREIVALIASTLAYGRVILILRSVGDVLESMQPSPYKFVRDSSEKALLGAFTGFKHRFTTGEQLGGLLVGVKHVLERYGSLNACFLEGCDQDEDTVVPSLSRFTTELDAASTCDCGFMLPDPGRKSACKRLNLFLRWMVRKDRVDPGGWEGVPASKLVVPLDTHMYRTGLALGFTLRKSADLRAALEITEGFRGIAPDDPVRYDFALTRLGIREDASLAEFLTAS